MNNYSLPEVRDAILTLYDNPNPETKKLADTWLQAFQHSAQAWLISLQLISLDRLELQYFGSTTIYSKIRNDWENIQNLNEKEMLLNEIFKVTKLSSKGQPIIFNRLCSSLAAIVIRMDLSQMRTFLQTIIELKRDEMKAFLLLFFGSLIDEEERAVFSFQRRSAIKKLLMEFSNYIIQIIYFILKDGPTELQDKALICLKYWTGFGISLNLFFSGTPPLFDLIFQSLQTNHFNLAIDVLLELLQKPITFTSSRTMMQSKLCFEQNGDQDIILAIISRILSLRGKYEEALKNNNLEFCRGICQLAVGVGEGHLTLLLQGSQEALELIDFLLLCTAHPNKKIAEISLDFWSLFESSIKDLNQNAFFSLFPKLLEILISQCSFPSNFTGWPKGSSEKEDFDSFRENSEPAFSAAYISMGSNYFQFLISGLKNSSTWQVVEAILFAIKSISVLSQASDEPLIPQILNYFLGFPPHSMLTKTGLQLLGDFCLTLDRNPTLLIPAINRIMESLNSQDKDISFCAADAFNKICQTSSPVLSMELSNMLNAYKEIKFQEMEDQLLVVRALVILISKLPPQDIPSAIQILNHNTIERLKQLLNTSSSNLNLRTAVLNQIQLFNAGISLPQGILQQCNFSCFSLESLLPFLYSCLTIYQTDEELASSICSSFNSLIYLEKNQIISHLGNLFSGLLDCLKNTKFPCFLRPFNTAIIVFGKENSTHFGLVIRQVSEVIFPVLQNDINSNAELIKVYFDLLGSTWKECKFIFLQDNLLVTVFQLCVACFQIQENETLTTILSFLEMLFFDNPSIELATMLDSIFQQYGEHLVKSIIKKLQTTVNCRPLLRSSLFYNLISREKLPEQSRIYHWIKDLLYSSMNENSIEREMTAEDIETFLKILFTLKDKRRFQSLISDFSKIANHQLAPDVLLSYQLA